MTNICEYKVRVKGKKNACYAFYGSMSCMDYKDVDKASGSGSDFVLTFSGNCKWSVDSYCNAWEGDFPVKLPSDADNAMEEAENKYWYHTVRERSQMFDVEVWCNSCDIDGEPDVAIYEHYKNGEPIVDELPEELEIDGTSDVQNVAEQVAQGQELNDLMGKMNDLLGTIENVAEDAGIDLHPSNIGETGYDLYNWTFTEGKRQAGNDWSIAIPDGFVVIDSKEDRLFEVVPQGMEENDADYTPVRILPGVEQPFYAISGDNWMFHPYARAGVAEIIGVHEAKIMAQMAGCSPEILSAGFADICAYIQVHQLSLGCYNYICSCITEGKRQLFRITLQYMTDEQKKAMDKSIIAWTETFKFNKPNPSMPKTTKFEELKVVNDLKMGTTTSFDEAVEHAQQEYKTAVNGRLGTIQFLAENGMLDESAPGVVREILTRGMEVKEFYYQRADELVEKLKSSQVKASTMEKVYTKFRDFENATTEISVDDEKITVDLPAKVKEIQKKWKAEAVEITKAKNTEAEAKREEEIRKYNEAHKKWEAEADAIKNKISAYVDEKIAEEKASLEAAAISKRDATVTKANAELKEQTNRKVTAKATLASLGMFKFSEKKTQKAIIEDATRRISDAQTAISYAESTYKSEMAEAGKKADNKAVVFRNAASKEYPMPDEPKKPI